MSNSTKYVPKHRATPTRTIGEAPRKALRNTVIMSSVAVAATGVAVSSGMLSSGGSATSAAGLTTNANSPLRDPQADVAEVVKRRTQVVSRSADRRRATDPVKEASLAVTDGPALTRTEDLAQRDPHDIARALLPKFGFSADQMGCLDSLWTRESGWNPSAENASSGAYGIPQALPGSKMASAGADWQTNPATQIEWGLGYIRDSYGSPCAAWGHSQSFGWY